MFRKYILIWESYRNSRWTGPTPLHLRCCLMPFSDLGVIVQAGSFMERALLCSRHCTKGFTACFSSVVHRSTAPASAGSLLERENLRSHPRPAASECALEHSISVCPLQSEKHCFHISFLIPHHSSASSGWGGVTKLVRGGALYSDLAMFPYTVLSFTCWNLTPS